MRYDSLHNSIMDFSSICRICLKTKNLTFDIFTCYYMKRNTSYCEMISSCTKLKPCLKDGLPRHICKECMKQLKRTYAFNIQCEESDRKLRFYLHHKIERDVSNVSQVKNEETKHEIENDDVKTQNFDSDDNKKELNIPNTEFLVSILENETNFKLEPAGFIEEPSYIDDGDEDCWNAEDDNLLLQQIKSEKTAKENVNEKEKPKKKRGRKKKVYPDGELPPLPESKLPHQCDICGKFLSTKSNLKAHKICHTDIRPYKCVDCPAAFRGHSALFQHKKVHSGETPYHCEYCPKQFSRRTGLDNHIRLHTGEKKYSCNICFKSFVQSAQLSIHTKRHKGDKPYLCQDCGKGFPIKADLRVHQRTHNGERPYPCPLCAKTFATSGNLSIHVRIHNKEVRYHCKECQRGFVTCSSYNVHLKRHKGQRDYHCECGKTFYTSSALKQHKVVHTGEKKYQCKICDRKFTQSSHLSRHFKRDHAKPNLPVPPSDTYKLVLNQGIKSIFGQNGPLDVQKIPTSPGVKCEGS